MFLLRDTSINSKEKVESNKMKKKKKKEHQKILAKRNYSSCILLSNKIDFRIQNSFIIKSSI